MGALFSELLVKKNVRQETAKQLTKSVIQLVVQGSITISNLGTIVMRQAMTSKDISGGTIGDAIATSDIADVSAGTLTSDNQITGGNKVKEVHRVSLFHNKVVT